VSVLLPYVLLLLVLLLCSAFFSGSESALFSLDRYALERLEEEGSKGGKAVRALLTEPRRLLATILLGNELVNVCISSVGLAAVYQLKETRGWDAVPWWLNIVVITPVLLLFGEIAPKALAVRTGVAWARMVGVPLRLFGRVVAPIRAVLHGIANLFLRLFGIEQNDPLPDALQEAQFRALVELGHSQGVIGLDEAELIHKVFDLADTPISRIMTPVTDVISVTLSSPLEEIVEVVRGARFSRIPVFAGATVRGVLLTKDLLRFLWAGERLGPRHLEDLVKPAYFVPMGKPSGELLQEFQRERGHMAIVLNEDGAMLGIVTLEDILQELFEPVEELEERLEGPSIERLSAGTYRVPARTEVNEWNKTMFPEIPPGDSYNTVAGYIFHLFGRLPRKGDQIRDDGWIYQVTGLEGTRLTWITATRRGDVTGGGTL